MGYETRAVLAVDTRHYEDIHWGKHQGLLESTNIEEDRILYIFDWDTGVHAALDYFMEEIVLKDDKGYTRLDTFGVIALGEDESDIEQLGEPWEFGIYLSRDIEYR
jgi:hypothetical protein